MQEMDPGPAKILHKPEKLKVTLKKCRSRMKRPVEGSYHPSIITGLLGSFNEKWQGFSMVCSESELRLVELFTFPGETKSLRKVILGQLAWATHLRNNFCHEKKLYHV